MGEVTEAWLAMVEAGAGLFDGRYDPEAAAASADADPDAGGLTRCIAAHHMWLAFLGEAWQVRHCALHCPRLAQYTGSRVGGDAATGLAFLSEAWQAQSSHLWMCMGRILWEDGCHSRT